jgi:hypothetical protein
MVSAGDATTATKRSAAATRRRHSGSTSMATARALPSCGSVGPGKCSRCLMRPATVEIKCSPSFAVSAVVRPGHRQGSKRKRASASRDRAPAQGERGPRRALRARRSQTRRRAGGDLGQKCNPQRCARSRAAAEPSSPCNFMTRDASSQYSGLRRKITRGQSRRVVIVGGKSLAAELPHRLQPLDGAVGRKYFVRSIMPPDDRRDAGRQARAPQ